MVRLHELWPMLLGVGPHGEDEDGDTATMIVVFHMDEEEGSTVDKINLEFNDWQESSGGPFEYLCTCEGKKGAYEHVLTITEGHADIIHKPCGMLVTDYPEDITLEEKIPVTVKWLPDGCDPPGGWHGDIGRCDCGYFLQVTLGEQNVQ